MPTKILAVDDSATMRKILEMTFAAEDVEIVTLADGAAAIQKAAESSPDIILADVSMQGVDAYAVAHAVKNNPALAKTAVIAMASQHHPYDEQKGQSAGIDAHVLKPFETQALIDLIANVLRAPRAVADEAPPAAPPMPTSTTQTTAAHIPPPPSAARPAAPAAAPSRKTPARPTTAFGESPPIPPPPSAAAPKPVLELADEPEIEIDAPEPPPKRPITRPIDTTTTQRGMAPARPIEPPAAKPAAAAPPLRAPSSPNIPAAKPAPSAPQRPAASPAAATPAAAPSAPKAGAPAAAVQAATSGLEAKLQGLGLSADQLNAILALSREVIEEVVWEVVPELAETLIKEEIARLTR